MAHQGSGKITTRPFGVGNLRIMTQNLWARVEAWMNQAFGGNEVTTANIPATAVKLWYTVKGDMKVWDNLLSVPHPMEHLSGSDALRLNGTDPRLLQHALMYRNVKNKLEQIVDAFCEHCKDHLRNNRRDNFYADYAMKARRYQSAANSLNSICDVINKLWVPLQREEYQVFSISRLCRIVWREMILRKIGFHLRAHLTTILTQERIGVGPPVDAEAMKNTLGSLVNSNYHSYHEIEEAVDLRDSYNAEPTPESKKRFLETNNFYVYFGNEYLVQTEQYLSNKLNSLQANGNLSNFEFMQNINSMIECEERCASRGFHPHLIARLGKLLTERLITPNLDRFIPLLSELLHTDRRNDFVSTFQLLSRVEGEVADQLATEMRAAFCVRGQAIIAALSSANGRYTVPHPVRFGAEILKFYNDIRGFIRLAMQDKPKFYAAMNVGISKALNENEISQRERNRIGMLLAQYIDYKMTTIVNTSKIPKAVKKIALILELLEERERFYELLAFHFGRRLLRQPSIELLRLEEEMIELLYRSVVLDKENFNIMLRDYRQTTALTNSFLQSRAAHASSNGETSFPVNIDTLKVTCMFGPHWAAPLKNDRPNSKTWKFPNEIEKLCKEIEEHLDSESHEVTHVTNQTLVDLVWSMGGKKFTLTNCNSPMFIVLSYFGGVDAATYGQIQQTTGLDDQNLQSVLDSLCRPFPRPTGGKRNRNPEPTGNDSILTKSDGPLYCVNQQFDVPFKDIDLSTANQMY